MMWDYCLFMRQLYHNDMKIPSQPDPRANQKRRTRDALVAAAAKLLADGARPTVPEAAAAAGISRATAYRYFPTQQHLLVEAAEITPMMRTVEDWAAAMPADGNSAARVLELQRRLNGVMFDRQVPMRTALRVYLDDWLARRAAGEASPDVRAGRRMTWIDAALAPTARKLPRARRRRLQAALALTMGVEATIVMKDVCRLDDDEAQSVLRWVASTLLAAELLP
jgi:AcrR family transcriptional regulator